jgi:hypothetical protein
LRYPTVERFIVSGSNHQETTLKLMFFIMASNHLYGSLLDFFRQPWYYLWCYHAYQPTTVEQGFDLTRPDLSTAYHQTGPLFNLEE